MDTRSNGADATSFAGAASTPGNELDAVVPRTATERTKHQS